MNKTVQSLKVEIEAIKKAQTEEILEKENLGKRTRTTDTSITNRIQDMDKRISDIEDRAREIDMSVEMLNLKGTLDKTSRKFGTL